MLRATRASIVFILRELRQRNRRVGTYIKAVLRKHIQRDELGPGRLPHDPYIEDMFSFLEAQLGLGTADEKPPKPEARKGGGSHPAEEKRPMGRGGGSRNGQERAVPKPKTEPAPVQAAPKPKIEPAPVQAAPNIPKGNDGLERHHVKGVQEQEALAGIQPKEEPEKPKKRRNPLLGHIG